MSAVLSVAVFPFESLADYCLLDSGAGEKLERFGDLVLARPDPQALWCRRLDQAEWDAADLHFQRESDRGGRWEAGPTAPKGAAEEGFSWTVAHRGASFVLRPTPFKHVGLFPEQAGNWEWLVGPDQPAGQSMLNLFGYTGVASVIAVAGGFQVTHVDASRQSLSWAIENLVASGLAKDSMRVICDDALAFARREVRRGKQYDAIMLDPPHYGRGPKGELWQLEAGLEALVQCALQLLAPGGRLVLSTYAVGHSPLTLQELFRAHAHSGDDFAAAELALEEEQREGLNSRLLPAGFGVRLRREREA
ncbi:MAG TPA: SAM-dependent methyltransferase [Planctomycetes bacterium]|nr:SAM-dependent methyltransferase [Planctomycetota bacterium]HIL36482.1 SAM-dependent methyltransferase [Planctomycetota bacterium]